MSRSRAVEVLGDISLNAQHQFLIHYGLGGLNDLQAALFQQSPGHTDDDHDRRELRLFYSAVLSLLRRSEHAASCAESMTRLASAWPADFSLAREARQLMQADPEKWKLLPQKHFGLRLPDLVGTLDTSLGTGHECIAAFDDRLVSAGRYGLLEWSLESGEMLDGDSARNSRPQEAWWVTADRENLLVGRTGAVEVLARADYRRQARVELPDSGFRINGLVRLGDDSIACQQFQQTYTIDMSGTQNLGQVADRCLLARLMGERLGAIAPGPDGSLILSCRGGHQPVSWSPVSKRYHHYVWFNPFSRGFFRSLFQRRSELFAQFPSSHAATALASDGRSLILTGNAFGVIRKWDARRRILRETICGRKKKVTALAPCSTNAVAAGYDDGQLHVWHDENGRASLKVQAHSSYVRQLLPLANGDLISISSGDPIRIWRPRRAGSVADLPERARPHATALSAEHMACWWGDEIGIYRLADDREPQVLRARRPQTPGGGLMTFDRLGRLVTLERGRVSAIDSPTGRRVVEMSEREWAQSGQLTVPVSLSDRRWCERFLWSCSGRYVWHEVTASADVGDDDAQVLVALNGPPRLELWDRRSARRLSVLCELDTQVREILRVDSQSVIMASDGRLDHFTIGGGLCAIAGSASLAAVAGYSRPSEFSDPRRLVLLEEDLFAYAHGGTIDLWSISSKERVSTWTVNGSEFVGLEIARAGKRGLLVGSGNPCLRLYDWTTREVVDQYDMWRAVTTYPIQTSGPNALVRDDGMGVLLLRVQGV